MINAMNVMGKKSSVYLCHKLILYSSILSLVCISIVLLSQMDVSAKARSDQQ
jgi:hypothetical protein